MKIDITISPSITYHDVDSLGKILNQTIEDHLSENDEIINIELNKFDNREKFYIYSRKK